MLTSLPIFQHNNHGIGVIKALLSQSLINITIHYLVICYGVMN
jgi:hypothetical protein